MSGYQKFEILILTSVLLVIVAVTAQDRWNYNDVDLRIAERQAIPHYIRHGVEYEDIDIKSILRQRGIVPKPRPTYNNRVINRPIQTVNNNYRKSVAMSNHLEPEYNHYNKKNRLYSKYGGKYKKRNFG